MLESTQVVFVHRVRLFVAGGRRLALLLEARALVVGIVQLAEGVGDLHAGDEELEAFDHARVPGAALRERRQLHRIVRDEDRNH